MLIFGIWQNKNVQHENIASAVPTTNTQTSTVEKLAPKKENILAAKVPEILPPYRGYLPKSVLTDSIVAYGIKLMGVPYLPAGITCEGFDCSGFVYHIFQKYGVDLPHSSALLAQEGTTVALENTRKGDLLIFTGTNKADRTPGHVGVVITEPGQTIAFVHASSVGGVKISKVKGTGYEKRFLQAKRVL